MRIALMMIATTLLFMEQAGQHGFLLQNLNACDTALLTLGIEYRALSDHVVGADFEKIEQVYNIALEARDLRWQIEDAHLGCEWERPFIVALGALSDVLGLMSFGYSATTTQIDADDYGRMLDAATKRFADSNKIAVSYLVVEP